MEDPPHQPAKTLANTALCLVAIATAESIESGRASDRHSPRNSASSPTSIVPISPEISRLAFWSLT